MRCGWVFEVPVFVPFGTSVSSFGLVIGERFPKDGSKLGFFTGGIKAGAANVKLIFFLNGTTIARRHIVRILT